MLCAVPRRTGPERADREREQPDGNGTGLHHANHFYGHAHVLARYCGLGDERSPRVPGYLQHGWNIGDGLAPGTPYVPDSPIYVWSEQTRRRADALGRRNVVVVGAPLLYLLETEQLTDAATEREGTIWYPFHGWEGPGGQRGPQPPRRRWENRGRARFS